MDKHPKFRLHVLTCGLAFVASISSVRPARAAEQFGVVVDEHGHRVFINASTSAGRPGGWLSNLPSKGVRPLPLPTPEIKSLVEKTASRFEVDPQLVHAIIEVESEYNPHAVSRKGAMGLMQLMSSTAERYGVTNPFDPKQNIEAGVSHLKFLLDFFGGDVPLSLAAYNSGTHAVERFGGIPAFSETKHYVQKVWNLYQPGSDPKPAKFGQKQPTSSRIYRYVDTYGVVHFTNVE